MIGLAIGLVAADDDLQDRLGRTREAQELIDQGIDPIDLMADQVRESFAEIGILVTLRQKLGKCPNGNQWITDFMSKSGCE